MSAMRGRQVGTQRAGVSFGVSRSFFFSTGNLAHLGDAVASIRWHDAGG